MNIPDHISESLETIVWAKMIKFFDADADPGIFLTLDPGWKKFGSSGINIPDPQTVSWNRNRNRRTVTF